MGFYYIHSKWFEFDSAHKIEDYEGKCSKLHGHTYKVGAVCKVDELSQNNISIDFGIINSKLKEVVEELDHKDLNEMFNQKNITAEFLASNIFRMLIFKGVPNLVKVIVKEGSGGLIEYEEVE